MQKDQGSKSIAMPSDKQTKYAPESKTKVKIDNHKATGYSKTGHK